MQSLLLGVVLALRALRRNALRASLTIGGLLIGVAAVIVVAGLSGGARDFIADRLQSTGTNLVIVFPRNNQAAGARHQYPLSEEDGRAILREVASVPQLVPGVFQSISIQRGERNVNAFVMGTTVEFFTIRAWGFTHGNAWTDTEEKTNAKVCVLGATLSKRIFGTEDPVGRNLRIGKSVYRVSGLLTAKGIDFSGQDQDTRLYMPIGTVKRRLAKSATPGAVNILVGSAASAAAAPRAQKQIDSLLRQRHHITDAPNYTITTQQGLLAMQDTVFDALTAFLVAVASISLLVGGVGVMNIMLASVTERTREIGVRLSIGASQGDVLTQFLVEATVLSAIGGALGIVTGLLALQGFEAALSWRMPVTIGTIGLAVGISGAIGVVFAFAPAYRASKLDPITALRHE